MKTILSGLRRRWTALAAMVLVLAVGLGCLRLWRHVRPADEDRYPALPEKPEAGVWYQVDPPGTRCADGTPWHGVFRKGAENNVIVYFFGGGIAFDAYTTAHSYSVARYDGFYFDTESWILDYMAAGGIGDRGEDNPFRDWTIIGIPYTTGDMHVGAGDWSYTDAEGKPATVRFCGYENYRAMLEAVRPLAGDPEALLILGTSAGGFGAALLAEDVMGYFPETENVTVCVDSSFLLLDAWPEVVRDMWHAPPAIAELVTTDNIVLDPLRALYKRPGTPVKLLYTCSLRDGELSRFQSYIDRGAAATDAAAGEAFSRHLGEMVRSIRRDMPEMGVFIWDDLPFTDSEGETLTRHTMLVSGWAGTERPCGKSVLGWVWDAVNGDVRCWGLELLEQ